MSCASRSTYFANDFAGRIASNIVQAAASLREFGGAGHRRAVVRRDLRDQRAGHLRPGRLATGLSAGAVDRRLCRDAGLFRAAASGGGRRSSRICARSLTGRIVDSYTNIQTVKLFAHLEREDEHAREALVDHTAAFHRQTRLITLLNLTVSTSNSVLIGRRAASPSGSGREAR